MSAMDRLFRTFAVVLLVVFAAGVSAHAAKATSMALAMSSAGMAGGDMGDCDGCPPVDDGGMLSCAQFCLTPFAALPVAVGGELSFAAAEIAVSPPREIVGHTGPPDPSPPRTTIL